MMRIFFLTPEAAPFSRTGGLGDVSYHLPRALGGLGHQVTVVSPKYAGAEKMRLCSIPEWSTSIDLTLGRHRADYYRSRLPEAHDALLIGCDELFDRGGLYGNEFGDYDDNAERFIFFCRAAILGINRLADSAQPTVIHSHDWPCGLAPMYLKSKRNLFPPLAKTASVFTYHNLANQGLFPHYDFAMTGLDWSLFTHEGLEFHGRMNLTKAGLLGADLITTVSHKYAQETLTPSGGLGLEGVLQSRRSDINTVLNGVDYSLWDPSRDPNLARNYSPANLDGKEECRCNLADLFGLRDAGRPTVAMVSRLLSRKGLDLIVKSLERLLALPLNMVFMGRGDEYYQNFLREAAGRYPDQLGVKISYDPILAHHITAGADILLLPSRFEPCGLEQLYALKYGSVPMVRATGGLDDTVIDVLADPEHGTGYKFNNYTPEALIDTLSAAVTDFKDRLRWRDIMLRGMNKNFSWEHSARSYVEIYEKALDKVQ